MVIDMSHEVICTFTVQSSDWYDSVWSLEFLHDRAASFNFATASAAGMYASNIHDYLLRNVVKSKVTAVIKINGAFATKNCIFV